MIIKDLLASILPAWVQLNKTSTQVKQSTQSKICQNAKFHLTKHFLRRFNKGLHLGGYTTEFAPQIQKLGLIKGHSKGFGSQTQNYN